MFAWLYASCPSPKYWYKYLMSIGLTKILTYCSIGNFCWGRRNSGDKNGCHMTKEHTTSTKLFSFSIKVKSWSRYYCDLEKVMSGRTILN